MMEEGVGAVGAVVGTQPVYPTLGSSGATHYGRRRRPGLVSGTYRARAVLLTTTSANGCSGLCGAVPFHPTWAYTRARLL